MLVAETPSQTPVAVDLLNYDRAGLVALMESFGEKSFRAQQLFRWIHARGISDFSQMTDLSVAFREHLNKQCVIQGLMIDKEFVSEDGTIKWLMRLEDGNSIETVFIPERTRGTLCISSQVGCALNCSFCSTGAQGFNRNLAVGEIIGQLWHAMRRLRERQSEQTVTNVVLMGMGEPLLNYDAVLKALSIMRDEQAYALPRRRVTLSTSGLVPTIDRLSQEADVSLAISLHAPNDPLRCELVPLNKKYPIAELMAACHRYVEFKKNRHITMEYVMLKGINDSVEHAKQLVKVLSGLACKVNLIPFNPFPGSSYQRSEDKAIDAFQNIVMRAGFVVTVRRTRGDDIDAACGQLVGKFIDKTQRQVRLQRDKRSSLDAMPLVLERVG